ncbi:hypothetical protein K502DRAFT_344306 [Neoconidiobolus thromboides FSU 785]|nr:hypothetical protein K502DRAFT_344306 [Neoconidiobolus thromboides FSU 785]
MEARERQLAIKEIKKEEQELNDLIKNKNRILLSLEEIENKIYGLETSYLEDTKFSGNVIKGFDQYLLEPTSSTTTTFNGFNNLKKQKNGIELEDRIFTLSGATDLESRLDKEKVKMEKKINNVMFSNSPRKMKENTKIKLKLNDKRERETSQSYDEFVDV